MGNKKSIPQINDECPISYIKSSDDPDGIVLNCGHYFNLFCLQKHCLKTFYQDIPSKCPLCNKKIKYSIIKKFYKNIKFISSDPSNWCRKEILNLDNRYSFNGIKFVTNRFSKNILIIVPICKYFGFNCLTYMYSPNINRIKVIKTSLLSQKTHLDNNFESLPVLDLCIEGNVYNTSNDWSKFIDYTIKYLKTVPEVLNMGYILKDKYLANKSYLPEQKMIFYFHNNYDNLNYVNINKNIIKKGFVFYEGCIEHQCVFQFQPLIYVINGKAHLVNKITGVKEQSLHV
tara:strand:- start:3657 stop:4517 length:861 start_codon:yes stop_codon:yes gene_type:complete